MKRIRESAVEKRLIREVERIGGKAIKLSSEYQRSLPDRLILLPEGKVGFAEVKSPTGRPTKGQLYTLSKLREMGFHAAIVNSPDTIQEFIDAL